MRQDDSTTFPGSTEPATERAPFPRAEAAARKASEAETLDPAARLREVTDELLEEREHRRKAEEKSARLSSIIARETERAATAERQARALGAQLRALDHQVVRRRRGRIRRALGRLTGSR